MHQFYINGEANTVEGFISVLANLNFDKDKTIVSIIKEKEITEKVNKKLKTELKDLTKEILEINEKLYNKNNVLVPIQSKDGVISIDKLYQDSLKELAQAEKGFNGLIEPYSKNDTNKE